MKITSLKLAALHPTMKGILFVLLWMYLDASPGARVVWAQREAVTEKVMELNRTGEWEQATRLAQIFLISSEPKSPAQRCQAYFGLAYAQYRLQRSGEAQDTLTIVDRECATLALDDWKGEAKRIREELASQPDHKRLKDDFWQAVNPATVGINARAL